MVKEQVARVAVSVYGDDLMCTASSPTTRIWVRGEDIYVSERNAGGVWKFSFHGARPNKPEAWQMGYTDVQRRSDQPPFPLGRSRLLYEWKPTPFVDHARTVLVMDTYRGALCASSFDDKAIQLRFPEGHEGFVRLYVLMTDFDEPKRACTNQVTAPMTVKSGRQVWLSWWQMTGSDDVDKHPAAATIMFPGLIDLDGIEAPHVVMRGGVLDFESFRTHLPSSGWPSREPVRFGM